MIKFLRKKKPMIMSKKNKGVNGCSSKKMTYKNRETISCRVFPPFPYGAKTATALLRNGSMTNVLL